MITTQQGDVLLVQTPDDGDINVMGGLVEMDAGLRTAAYISLFGGNEDDSGADKSPHNWWGNIGQRRQIRSETQHLLQSIPATSGNLLRVEAAVKRDLQWLLSDNVAKTITARAIIPAYNQVKIIVSVDDIDLEFVNDWSANK